MLLEGTASGDITSRLAELSPAKRALLQRRLQVLRAQQRDGRPAIPRRVPGEPVPMSFAQQRLWFLSRLEPAAPLYVNVGAVRIRGQLDVDALRGAFDTVVARHEALRTSFASSDTGPVQIVRDHHRFAVPVRDLRGEPAHERSSTVEQIVEAELRRPFDLSQDVLLRARLLRLADDEHVLVLAKHHIADDAWSAGVLARELRELYAAFADGRPSPLAELPAQYADVTCWQRAQLDGAHLADQLAFWRRQLADPPILELPTDAPRPMMQSFRGSEASVLLPKQLLEGMQRVARGAGATLFMAVLSVFQTLLMRYTGQHDLVVGSPLSGRNRPEMEELIGLFLNPVALRTNLEGDPSFRELLGRVRGVVLDAFAHPDVPFEQIVEELRLERDPSRTPIFSVLFIFQNAPRAPLELPGLQTQDIPRARSLAQYDLTLNATVLESGLRLQLEYSTDLFQASSMRRLLGHVQTLWEAILADPDMVLSRLPMLSPAERQQMIVDWNATRTDYPAATMHGLFEGQVERTPSATALVGPDGERVTYAELNGLANHVAHHLLALGVSRQEPIGVCLERNVQLAADLLGVLKAGAAFVPLDPASPPGRLEAILADCGARVLLTQRHLADRLPTLPGVRQVCLDAGSDPATSNRNPGIDVQPDELAYVIYTSGSTGQPKGVLGPHAGAINRFQWMWDAYPFEAGEVSCARTSIGFVDAIWELFGPLLRGVPTALVPDELAFDPRRLVEQLAERDVTRVVLVPSLLRAMLDTYPDLQRRLPRLHLWTSSGEALPAELALRFRQSVPGARLLNLYGTSEVAADATWCDVSSLNLQPGEHVPIGRPIANMRVYVLDPQLQPVPVGVIGELCVAGAGLALGYLNRPELTAERFVADPLTGDRLYRTGDLGRQRADGTLDLLGRADTQVKVRGVRVELGEIEAVLERHPSVTQSVVVLREDSPADQRLVAYCVVATGSSGLDGRELREHLRRWLPANMLPAHFVTLARLPRLPNGKVDRASLPAVAPEVVRAPAAEPPLSALERQLAEIWGDVLGVANVGRDDDFFELGGHSLLAVRLFTLIERQLGRTLPLVLLFQAPTIAGLALAIERDDQASHWRTLVPIQPHGSRHPIFWVHRFGGGILGYAELARHLGRGQPFYALQPHGLHGEQGPQHSVEELATEYLRAVRTVQPSGPYFLGGHCFGGTVAFEMAQQLRAGGEEVRLLALIEAYASQPDRRSRWHRASLLHAVRNLAPWFAWYGRHTLRLAPRQLLARLSRLRRLNAGHIELRDISPHADELPERYRQLMRVHLEAAVKYRPAGYDGRVTVFRCQALPIGRGHEPDLGWSSVTTGGVDVYRVPGEHDSLLQEPYVAMVADALRACLTRLTVG